MGKDFDALWNFNTTAIEQVHRRLKINIIKKNYHTYIDLNIEKIENKIA